MLAAAPLFALLVAATYEVGPGKPLANVGDVPWESLNAGDTVLIHWRATPYKEKFVLCRQGTQAQPITVRGVLGPGGERPVLVGDGATTRSQLNFWGEERGLVKIGGANKPADLMPQYLVLENLELATARQPYSFTGRNGTTAYAKNAAALYIEKGEHLVVRNCVLRDSGNGLFCGAQTRDLLVEGSHLHGNGVENSVYEHNNYTAAVGITFQHNRFGPLRAGCLGNNLKDRSVGTVVRYNWIEGGNRALDLVDAEDDPTLTSDPRYRETFVYGNVLLKGDGGNNQVVHYGGDSGDESLYRKGTLHFFQNTVVSTRSGNTTLLRLSTNAERAEVRNNVLYVTQAGSRLGLLDSTGVLDLWNNWTKPGWVQSHSGLTGTINDHGGAVTGTAPGFVDEAGQDFQLTSGSACLDKGTALAAAASAHPVTLQYRKHQAVEPRPLSGALDLGAYEHCVGACAGTDAGVPMPADAAGPGIDASSPFPDATTAGPDARLPSPDAAAATTDAGLAGADAQAALPDASTLPESDAGRPGTDAAHLGDGGGVPSTVSSCQCQASSGPSLGLLALVALARRRRVFTA